VVVLRGPFFIGGCTERGTAHSIVSWLSRRLGADLFWVGMMGKLGSCLYKEGGGGEYVVSIVQGCFDSQKNKEIVSFPTLFLP